MAQRQNVNINRNQNNINNPNNINQNNLNPNRNPNIANNYISTTYDPTTRASATRASAPRAPLTSSNISTRDSAPRAPLTSSNISTRASAPRAPLTSSNISKSLPELPPPPQNYPQPSYVNNMQQNIQHHNQQQQQSQPQNRQQSQPQQNIQSNILPPQPKVQPSLDYLQSNYNDSQAYTPPTNTSTKNSQDTLYSQTSNRINNPGLSGKPPSGIPMHPNRNNNTGQMTLYIEKVSEKIYGHFKNKYPTTIDASGFNKNTIISIVEKASQKEQLNEKSIGKIIDILDHKFKMTINSNNRQGAQYDTTTFSMDENSKIPMEKFLENYTNKVAILVDSDKAIEAELPKNMSPATDMVKITPPEPFSEDFPIRDRDKQTDMMIPQVREYDYYIAINSNDRNIVKYPEPNNFVIDFAPAPSGDSPQVGYVDRVFHNIKACDLLSVVIRDTSDQPDSSDSSSLTSNSYPYLLLQLNELQNNFSGTNAAMSQSFAMLTDYCQTGKYKYYNIVGNLSDETIFKVYNPRINLSKLTTRLLLPNGTPFNFGEAYINDTSNSCITFAFRVTTIQKNLSTQFLNTA